MSENILYYEKVKALFSKDSDIDVRYINDVIFPTMIISVYNNKKCTALRILLPKEKAFGDSSKLIIEVNNPTKEKSNKLKILEILFDRNNKAVSEVNVMGFKDPKKLSIVFENTPVKVNENDISLYHELAKEVFDDIDPSVFKSAKL